MLLVGRIKIVPGYLEKDGSGSSMMLFQSPSQSSAGTSGDSMSPAIVITPARQPKILGVEEGPSDFLGAEARSLREDIFAIINVLSAGIISGERSARRPAQRYRAYIYSFLKNLL